MTNKNTTIIPESHYQPKLKKDIVPRIMFLFCITMSLGFIATGIYLSNV